MNIKPEIDPSKFEVGVLIARLQVDNLHQGHIDLINFVTKNHQKTILFLGVPVIENSKKNPLDFSSRADMVREHFPNLVIFPIKDQRYNDIWSKKLDETIPMAFGEKSTVLYGSRDSFIPHYNGKYPTIELAASIDISGSEIRDAILKDIPRKTPDFRAGVIYGIHSKRDVTYSAVDIIAYNENGQILMGRKPNETNWRFIGGFVDRDDDSYESAAVREFKEEAGGNCSIGSPRYILSQQVDDWRYKREKDGIMTTLFLAPYQFGMAEKSDDIEEVKWVDVKTFSNYDGIRTNVMLEHRDMMTKFIDKVYDENLIPNIGERLQERNENVTYLTE